MVSNSVCNMLLFFVTKGVEIFVGSAGEGTTLRNVLESLWGTQSVPRFRGNDVKQNVDNACVRLSNVPQRLHARGKPPQL